MWSAFSRPAGPTLDALIQRRRGAAVSGRVQSRREGRSGINFEANTQRNYAQCRE
jgi:hypothetical protein